MDTSCNRILVTSAGIATHLSLSQDSLLIEATGSKPLPVPLRQVLSANFSALKDLGFIEIYYVLKEKKSYGMVRVEGQVSSEKKDVASAFVQGVMEVAYAGLKRSKSLKVFVNPFGGIGKAASIFNKKVEPIFRAANCTLDVTHTTHRGHAEALAQSLPLSAYDAIVVVSGDGLVHELLNGLALHSKPLEAFDIPIAPIPTGSGNALSLNLLGLDDGFDVVCAALNVIKGKPMKIDLFAMTQKGKRSLSFMSQCLGLMAELDIGTENLRWMGDTRFVVGLFKGMIAFKPTPIQLSIKVREQNKQVMYDGLLARQREEAHRAGKDRQDSRRSSLSFLDSPVAASEEGWLTFDKPVLYMYAGQGPYVGRDYMAFPVSLPDDGVIDILVQEPSSRLEILKGMDSAPKGEPFWQKSLHYYKATAYRVTPISSQNKSKPKGTLSIDGEEFPFEEYRVDVHQKMGTVLSMYGMYKADFTIPPK